MFCKFGLQFATNLRNAPFSNFQTYCKQKQGQERGKPALSCPDQLGGRFGHVLFFSSVQHATAGFSYRAGAETPPPTFEKLSEFLSERFSQRWIPKPQFLYPLLRLGSQLRIPRPLFFLVFRFSPLFLVFVSGDKFLLRHLSPKLGSQHQLRLKTPPSFWARPHGGIPGRWGWGFVSI